MLGKARSTTGGEEMSVYNFLDNLYTAISAQSDITDIVPSSRIYKQQHPMKETVYPLVVLRVETKKRYDTQSTNTELCLDVDILTQSNTTRQLSDLSDLLREFIDNGSVNDVCAGISYICQLDAEFPVDTSKLKIAPLPLGLTMKFFVLKST